MSFNFLVFALAWTTTVLCIAIMAVLFIAMKPRTSAPQKSYLFLIEHFNSLYDSGFQPVAFIAPSPQLKDCPFLTKAFCMLGPPKDGFIPVYDVWTFDGPRPEITAADRKAFCHAFLQSKFWRNDFHCQQLPA